MEVVNLTPHDVVLVVGETRITIPSSGVARAREERTVVGELNLPNVGKVPIYSIAYGEPEGLPAPQPGVIYIVSAITAQAVKAHQPERDDVYVVSDPVRDEQGRIIGARALARV